MRAARALGALLIAIGLSLGAVSTATAQQTLPPRVTDSANYPDTPQAMLTPGCDADGDVSGVAFSLNGGAPAGGLADLPEVKTGDVLTMTWTGVSADCVGSAISLSVKVAQEPAFNPNVDQLATPGGYNVATLTNGPGSLSLTLPDLQPFGFGCAYQIDAIVGVPLQVVGPSGSYYSASVRGDDRRTTAFSWRNGAYTICVAQAAQTTTTTTVPAATTTTAAAATATTALPASTTTTPPTTTTTAAQSALGVEAAQASRTLAATGANPAAAVVGIAGVLLGLTLVAVSRRRQISG